MEDLLAALSDHLLQSGFQRQYMDYYDQNAAEQTLEDLRNAIAEALMNSDMLDQQLREQIESMSAEQFEQLIEQLIDRMEQEDYISIDQPHDPARPPPLVERPANRKPRRALKSPTKGWTSWDSARCATCWVRSASPASDATTPATPPPESRPAERRRPTSSATPSTSTLPRRCRMPSSAKGCIFR